jgi:hypothetical protein
VCKSNRHKMQNQGCIAPPVVSLLSPFTCCYLSMNANTRKLGYIATEIEFSNLIQGNLYADKFLRDARKSLWVEDWWDEKIFRTSSADSFWKGDKAFCERIYSYVERDDVLRKERAAIRARTWPPKA